MPKHQASNFERDHNGGLKPVAAGTIAHTLMDNPLLAVKIVVVNGKSRIIARFSLDEDR